ncbi:MAG: UPF0175 family protein [Pseudomonadota bacterium]
MAQTVLNLEIPHPILLALKVPKKQWAEYLRQTLAVEFYREGKLSLGKAREFAGLSNKWEMIQLLNERGVDLNYSADDSIADLETLNKLLS